mgnify:CR=1 FL=1
MAARCVPACAPASACAHLWGRVKTAQWHMQAGSTYSALASCSAGRAPQPSPRGAQHDVVTGWGAGVCNALASRAPQYSVQQAVQRRHTQQQCSGRATHLHYVQRQQLRGVRAADRWSRLRAARARAAAAARVARVQRAHNLLTPYSTPVL